MKIILSEDQFKKLTNNILEDTQTSSDYFGKLQNALSFLGKLGGFKNDNNQTSDNIEFADNIPTGNDMMHPLGKKFNISSKFGKRDTGIRGASKQHKGIDIKAPSGTPVYTPKDGKVDVAKDTTPNGCGGFIKITHDNVITKFCHLKQWVVKPGDMVKKGQLIGYTGGGPSDPYRGTSSGAHLHYEIRTLSDIAQNPLNVQSNLV